MPTSYATILTKNILQLFAKSNYVHRGWSLASFLQVRGVTTQEENSSEPKKGSSKLWADAEREEAEEAAREAKQPTLPGTHENWTGEESIQDAVQTIQSASVVEKLLRPS